MSEDEIKHLMQSHYNLHEKYEQLKQENQQLKEECEKQRYAITENCDLRKEILKLEETLDKIREYVDNLPFKDLIPIEVKVIKKILDKVKE